MLTQNSRDHERIYFIDLIIRTIGDSIFIDKIEKTNPDAVNVKNPEQAKVIINM